MKKIIYSIFIIVLTNMLNAQTIYTDFKKFDDNIYIIWFEQYGVKTLISEFDEYLVVVEFPYNEKIAMAIINKATEVFPEKPIKYVLHSHHHSHSVSSFDPFLKYTNASLITSPYNYERIRNETIDTTLLKERHIEIDSTFRIASKNNELICYNIYRHQYAVPTQEYMIIFFPKQSFLVTGCLYQKPIDYHRVITPRVIALKQILDDYQITANYFLPTNTVRVEGFEDICTLEMLDSTLAFGLNPDEVADFFQSKSLAYLESVRDSLIIQLKKIPTFYDYNIVARALLSRKEYAKSLLIFNLIINNYSEYSHRVYFYMGECYEYKGDIEKAIYYFEKFNSCAISEEEISLGKQRINKLTKKQ